MKASTIVPAKSIGVTGLRGIPGVMGGVETHCEELLPRVAAIDPSFCITVFCRARYLPQGPAKLGRVDIVPLFAPAGQRSEAIISTLVGVWHAHRRGCDLIHIHAVGPGLLSPIARMLRMRLVVTHHGADYERFKWGAVARTMLRLGERFSAMCAHRVICVSPSLTKEMKARFPRHQHKFHYIPNGAPALTSDGRRPEDVLSELGLRPRRYILTVGRLVPEKGIDYLLEAYRRSGSDLMLVIAGAADHASSYSQELLAQGGSKIRFLGVQPRSTLKHLYDNAALFVLPSFHEGLPIVALEAARCGTPMLLSNIQPNLDIGLSPANYFEVGDVQALSKALTAPPHTFSVDSEVIGEQFDWDAIADQTLRIYRGIL